ncbi:MAG TPA: phosphoribosylformylglycinamidine synthase subunit PurL, partial [Acidimicrobiales bacterium]|nr:phosphoribosylformylglycinamidine synthase subunit PurL [Acidimicrobiales bacterium]
SRIHLRRLPSEGEAVLVGPGEGAGVVDVGDGIAAALRIESHNHPSAVEPYQGAATGVGGILRDVFTMGARPIAVMDSLRVGTLDEPRSRWILEGVVNGVSGYGNAVGVPTIGGEVVCDATYADNPLVNVLCLGLLPHERLIRGRASGPGNLVVLLGSTTGRDGIGGASVLASAGFSDEDGAKRPSVQVGDPFEEKRLIEACLELLERSLAVGVQDLGGAGLTCATSETASKGGAGMDVWVKAVPQREPGMAAVEVMTSESQERMLAIVTPENLEAVLELAGRWDVRATVVGCVTGTGRLRILAEEGGEVLGDVPAASLEEDKPQYDRPRHPPADRAERQADDPVLLRLPTDCGPDLLALLADPSVADTTWVHRQYDSQLFLNTVISPGADAAVLRLKAPGVPAADGTKGIALSTDGNGRWCSLDPRRGTAMVVAEAALNVATAGARPLCLVNNLNFGNPEHPEVMWQLSEAIDGMAEACLALDLPVVGGNVSLYNESQGRDIDPSPIVGVVGLIDELDVPPPSVELIEGGVLLLLGGRADAPASLAGSLWADLLHGHRGGQLPPFDLDQAAGLCRLLVDLVADGLVYGVHDVSDGGLAVCLAELCIASDLGVELVDVAGASALFSEAGGRVVVCADDDGAAAGIARRVVAAGIPHQVLGTVGGDLLAVEGLLSVPVAELSSVWRNALPRLMA